MKNFKDKVEIERSALKLINGFFGEKQLFGLSSAAVKTWQSHHPNCTVSIFNSLIQLSEAVCALTERSGEKFDDAYNSSSKAATKAFDKLKKLLG
jgi:hypothetical protein